MKNDSFCPKEKVLDIEVPHLNVIVTLTYLVNCTRPNIISHVNLHDIILHQFENIRMMSNIYSLQEIGELATKF